MTYNQLIYYILDALKLSGKSSYYNEDHIIFLMDKYRSFLLKQKYSDVKKPIPESNFQSICLELTPAEIGGQPCDNTTYLKSAVPVPTLSSVSTPFISTSVIPNVRVVYVSRNRLAHVGHNKFLKNIIYCAIGSDNHLYLRSFNSQLSYLENIQLTGIFQDSSKALAMSCNEGTGDACADPQEAVYPLEDALIPNLIQLIMQDLLGASWRPKDNSNNDKDDLADIMGAAQRLMNKQYMNNLTGNAQ